MPNLIDPIYFEQLAALDPAEVCARAQCTCDRREAVYTATVWGQDYTVAPQRRLVEAAGNGPGRLHPYFDLFLVHYLLHAQAIEPAGQWMSEKEIPGGATFFRGPHAIPTDLVASRFGNDLAAFARRCRQLQGHPLDLADAAFAFTITPRLPVAVLYWLGDKDFPPEAKILFDRTITRHLATDIVFAVAVGICKRLAEVSG